MLEFVPYQYKTIELCERAVEERSSELRYSPN